MSLVSTGNLDSLSSYYVVESENDYLHMHMFILAGRRTELIA